MNNDSLAEEWGVTIEAPRHRELSAVPFTNEPSAGDIGVQKTIIFKGLDADGCPLRGADGGALTATYRVWSQRTFTVNDTEVTLKPGDRITLTDRDTHERSHVQVWGIREGQIDVFDPESPQNSFRAVYPEHDQFDIALAPET